MAPDNSPQLGGTPKPSGDSRPIGVFDSGLGGLTVLKQLMIRFPEQDFIYLGDTARLPYGSKSPQNIRRYSEQNLNFLCQQDVKALVVACNSASTQILESEFLSRPIYTVIRPGARRAVELSVSKKIGVLGTRATIASGAYVLAAQQFDPRVEVFSVACPLFVPLAEEGWCTDPLTNLIAYRYLKEIAEASVDTLILGCTHYPLLSEAISKVMGPRVTLIDSGDAVADEMSVFINSNPNPSSSADSSGQTKSSKVKIFVTDESSQFQIMAERILGPSQINGFNLISL